MPDMECRSGYFGDARPTVTCAHDERHVLPFVFSGCTRCTEQSHCQESDQNRCMPGSSELVCGTPEPKDDNGWIYSVDSDGKVNPPKCDNRPASPLASIQLCGRLLLRRRKTTRQLSTILDVLRKTSGGIGAD